MSAKHTVPNQYYVWWECACSQKTIDHHHYSSSLMAYSAEDVAFQLGFTHQDHTVEEVSFHLLVISAVDYVENYYLVKPRYTPEQLEAARKDFYGKAKP